MYSVGSFRRKKNQSLWSAIINRISITFQAEEHFALLLFYALIKKIKKFKKTFIILKKSAIIYNNDYCAEKFIMED
jgi:hypothetical protein